MDSGGLPEERVRRALAHLGADAASAPDVPAAVITRLGAALRAAPPRTPQSPAGPTAERNTVSVSRSSGDTPNPVVTRP